VNNVATQDSIYKLQDIIKDMPQVTGQTRHYFSDGMYARELFIPAGTVVVGALHKSQHLYMVVKGKCKVSSQYETVEIEAPYIGETIPGTKRVIYAETDCVWIGFFPTQLTDIDKIEAALIEPEEI
tara:strand:+ start:3130 stop:3507 length:378 start_codon:yes stop_codon:yes gene_type:complete